MSDLSSRALMLLVAEVLRNAPEWARRDLAANDGAARARAEDTLAAMIAAGLGADRQD